MVAVNSCLMLFCKKTACSIRCDTRLFHPSDSFTADVRWALPILEQIEQACPELGLWF